MMSSSSLHIKRHLFTLESTRRKGGKKKMESVASEPEVLIPSSFLSSKKKEEEENHQQQTPTGEPWPRRSKGSVMLEGYIEGVGSDGLDRSSDDAGDVTAVGRTRSLTDEDLDELKACLDLGFGFSYDGIPELCGTLPALELCYSLSQRFLDERQQHGASHEACPQAQSSPPLPNWKISSPGDHPEDVKARLKYWAQAVACTVRLCS